MILHLIANKWMASQQSADA